MISPDFHTQVRQGIVICIGLHIQSDNKGSRVSGTPLISLIASIVAHIKSGTVLHQFALGA